MIVSFFVENWQWEDIFCYPEGNRPRTNEVFEAKLEFHGDNSLCEAGPLVLEEVFPESTVYFLRSRISEVLEKYKCGRLFKEALLLLDYSFPIYARARVMKHVKVSDYEHFMGIGVLWGELSIARGPEVQTVKGHFKSERTIKGFRILTLNIPQNWRELKPDYKLSWH